MSLIVKKYPVLAHPRGAHFEEVAEAVRTVNALQTYFHCELIEEPRILKKHASEIDAESLAEAIGRKHRNKRVIAITESYYSSGYVLEEQLPSQILVTCADWKEKDAPSLATYLLHSLASSLITFEAKLSDGTNELMGHKEAVGCLFDWWNNSEELAVILVCARMCEQCEGLLASRFNVPSNAIKATNRILEHVRRKVLRLDPQVPTKVFVAHGWSEDWKDLKRMLVELGIEIAEFNEVPPIGRTIPDRWKEMLDQSRFAFALLTPDEEVAPGKWLPRPNVIHEIGLCQGRLGLESTVVLREKSVELFSNLDGVIDIPFEKGRLKDQRESIVNALRVRGLLHN